MPDYVCITLTKFLMQSHITHMGIYKKGSRTVQIYVKVKCVPFLMSLSTATLSHRKCASAWTSRGSCHSQVREQRDTV